MLCPSVYFIHSPYAVRRTIRVVAPINAVDLLFGFVALKKVRRTLCVTLVIHSCPRNRYAT
jgi:hypothetical protein